MSTDPVQAASEEPPAGRPAGAGDAQDPSAGAAESKPTAASDARGEPSEEELRAAYEAEMSRISSADMILQAAVSLLNIGAYRLQPSAAGGEQPAGGVRDLEQVRDAIDGARALLPILERRRSNEIRPLRDALSQLQMAYAREAGTSAPANQTGAQGVQAPPAAGPKPQESSAAEPKPKGPGPAEPKPKGPGPAESSGRLWVPGR